MARDLRSTGSHLSGEADESSSSLRDIDPSRIEAAAEAIYTLAPIGVGGKVVSWPDLIASEIKDWQWLADLKRRQAVAAFRAAVNLDLKSEARAALARMEAREGEDVDQWAERLAADSVQVGEAEYEIGETTEALVARLEAELGVKGINSVFRRALAMAKEASADAKLPKGLVGIVSDDVIRAIDAEAPFYQFREIGEGQDWQFCSKAVYDSFARDPHIDTREVPASEVRRPQGIEAVGRNAEGGSVHESPSAEGGAP